MIDVKEATMKAQKYFQQVYTGGIQNLILEEVEYTEDRDYWLITFSFSDYRTFGALRDKRRYKQFKIDVETGEVESMKIREIGG